MHADTPVASIGRRNCKRAPLRQVSGEKMHADTPVAGFGGGEKSGDIGKNISTQYNSYKI